MVEIMCGHSARTEKARVILAMVVGPLPMERDSKGNLRCLCGFTLKVEERSDAAATE